MDRAGPAQTADANSPSVSTTWLAISLTSFVLLYIGLLVLDIGLMRHYANLDPADAEPEEEAPESPPAVAY